MGERFAVEADPEVLADLRAIAADDAREVASVVEDALRLYVEQRRGQGPRAEVLQHLDATVAEHRELYRRLAQ